MKKYFVLFFLIGFSMVSVGQELVNVHKNLIKAKNPAFVEEQELGLFLASKLILENHHLRGSREYVAAERIVRYWLDKEKWFKIPMESTFHQSLSTDATVTFIHQVASINYILNQKINQNRFLKCTEGKNKKERKEVQLAAAKTVLKYSFDNQIALPNETQKFVEAYQNNTLEKLFFKK
jgi:hypothetical protein